jgi:hypothetical protein
MNLQDTVARMFPAGVVTAGDPESGGFVEVHGLPCDTVPRHCSVLASGQFQYVAAEHCQESYLVKAEDFVLFVRICPSRSGVGYAQVAVRNS